MKMKTLRVKELIELLKTQDPEADVSIEGCDCEGECVGISKYEFGVLIRRERGVYDGDYQFKIVTKVE